LDIGIQSSDILNRWGDYGRFFVFNVFVIARRCDIVKYPELGMGQYLDVRNVNMNEI
jgi:hypothetical protein